LFLELFRQRQFLFVFGIVPSASVFVCFWNCSVSVSFCLFLELFRQCQFLFVFRIVPSASVFVCFWNCSVSVSFCLFLELFRQRQFLFVFGIVLLTEQFQKQTKTDADGTILKTNKN
jgi:hypothetical protein